MNRDKSSFRQGAVVWMMLFAGLGFLLPALRFGSTPAAVMAAAAALAVLLADTLIAGILGADRLILSLAVFFCSAGLMVRACTMQEFSLLALLNAPSDLTALAESLIQPVVLLLSAFCLSRRQVLLSWLSFSAGAAILFLMNRPESALILGITVFLLYWASGGHPAGVVTAAAAIAGLGLAAYFFRPEIREIIRVWQEPAASADAASSLAKTLAAVAEGGLFGTGPGLVLPDLPGFSDPWFAFAALCHQFGIVTAILLLLLFGLLALRGTTVARAARKGFHGLAAMGSVLLLSLSALCSAAGAWGILPSAGIPFPFLSGGPSLVRDLFLLAILCWISGHNRQDLKEDASLAMLSR